MTMFDDPKQRQLVFGGGGHYEGNRWWSDHHHMWFPADFDHPHAYAEVRAVQVGTKWGRSFGLGLFMQSGIVKRYQFQLRARSSQTTWVDLATEFLVLYRGGPETIPVEQNTQEALDMLHEEAVSLGWVPLERTGFEWYSYTYSHPSITMQPL